MFSKTKATDKQKDNNQAESKQVEELQKEVEKYKNLYKKKKTENSQLQSKLNQFEAEIKDNVQPLKALEEKLKKHKKN